MKRTCVESMAEVGLVTPLSCRLWHWPKRSVVVVAVPAGWCDRPRGRTCRVDLGGWDQSRSAPLNDSGEMRRLSGLLSVDTANREVRRA